MSLSYDHSPPHPIEFSFFEHIFIGALDHGDLNLARSHLDVLEVKFPESSRVSRLRGMLAEAEGNEHVVIANLLYL